MDDIFDLKEFLIAILRKWRIIILLAVLFALLGGLYKIIPGAIKLGQPKELETERKLYEDNLTAYQQQKEGIEREIENINEEIDHSEDYNKNSLLMKINPYNESVSVITLFVDTGYQIMPGMDYQNPDKTYQILSLYLMMARDGSLYQRLQEELFPDTDVRYLQEIVSVYREESDSITIRAIGNHVEETKKIVDFIYQNLLEKQPVIAQGAGEHTIQILNHSDYITVDLTLRDTQNANNDKVANLGIALTDQSKALLELKEPENTLTSKKQVLLKGIKFAVFGGFSGAFLGVFIGFLIDILDPRIKDRKRFQKHFGLRFIGSLKL